MVNNFVPNGLLISSEKKPFVPKIFQFGSVPLKTYLPDGDIDLTVFGINQALPETFISEILQKLESQINNESSEFRVKEVQFIQAEVDNLIGNNHIFKQSIILVKAWCYHESRILGSNSGLFPTYALKVLVLYLFNLYGNGFAGPFEVLFRFLEFYSKFDWENYCISLSGPVPLSSLPDMTAEPPRKDCQSQDLLLPECFLSACMFFYGNMPRSQENQEKQFVSKHINIIDPLRLDNNLGRSISKVSPSNLSGCLVVIYSTASFYRIRSAFRLGTERMVRLLQCTDEYLIAEFDDVFKNTWNRHGNGYWIHVSIYNLYIRKVGKLTWQESEDEQAQASNKPDNQLKESNQKFRTSDACVVSQTQSSSPESAPIYSEAQNQHCDVFVSKTESELFDFSSSMSDSKMGSTSRSEVQQCFGLTSCDLRSEDAVKSKNASNMGLHKEEPDCATIIESSRTLHALMDHSVDKEEHGGVVNMTGSSRSGYLEAVKGVKSNNNEAMRQKEEEHHFVSTAENRKSLKYLDVLLGVKKSHTSFSPPPQQNRSYSIDKVEFPELEPPFPTVKRSRNVGKDSVDPPAVMNPAESCKYTQASDSTSVTNLSSLPPETTQPENVHDQSTVSTDIVRHEGTSSESVALNVHAPLQVQQAQYPELKPPFPTVKRLINVGKDSVDPSAVVIKHGNKLNPAESCKYTPASDSTSETNLSSLPPETTQPENVHGQSTVSTDIFRHESTTSESVALNVHALQSACASGSSVLQFPFKSDNTSHVEPSNYLLNQSFDILYGDFKSYWVNLKYGQHCVNEHSEEPVYFLPTVELPMDFQEQYYWDTRPSGSVNGVPLVVPGMPPIFASDSHIEGIHRGVSFWLPGSSGGLGTFMPNPHTYHERQFVEEFYNENQNANNISERQEDSNFNSRGRSSISNYRQRRNLNSNSRERFSSRGQNHYRRNGISEGKKEASHKGEGEGSSSAVNELEDKKEAPDQGEGEGSSSAVNELENLEKDSIDDSPYRP
ncbi:hypothetical protein TSUD_400060 [Trifolium subterraneum]|uniref:PAP/OAS1 substrate-binding-related domain-containing protein n=1 Tax=Trifolium subterraneum TaxID=3900 RepID=A0A2Z6P535_TRISU|nr:hypothetical protein TSUD_400060 [Trifolium subterraneum]